MMHTELQEGNTGGHCYVGCSFLHEVQVVIPAQQSTSCRSVGTGLFRQVTVGPWT